MTISQETETFFNKPVAAFVPGEAIDTGKSVYRLALDYDDEKEMVVLIDEFLAQADKAELDALIIGSWGAPAENGVEDILAKLVALAPELPKLRALFIGDMTFEECEISWIIQGDYTPLLAAFPQLEALRIRGGTDLEISPFTHQALRSFTIESGGLPAGVAESLAASSMPKLAHLELWLGTEEYGFSGDVALYRRVLDALLTPELKYLGLRDSEIADELAVMLASHPVLGQLDTLDLSLGTIGDTGAEALYGSQLVARLTCLNLSHHYISAAWQAKLGTLPLQVLLDDPAQEDDGDRYVAVGE
ncbi:hypothetical protein ASD15_10315 [Massilia sp. Root351]|jgi:hypothetical protein|uniref:STM4015 family protein n=1 Tax=Massilia sp. Root351 TaxID=1736522 RepID=UPI0007095AA1|nr:STM4015 family protein [Massilia sp. Root351]KQV82421.1 hypothetical protein ASD15_10315 [Massilia sp. Root351]